MAGAISSEWVVVDREKHEHCVENEGQEMTMTMTILDNPRSLRIRPLLGKWSGSDRSSASVLYLNNNITIQKQPLASFKQLEMPASCLSIIVTSDPSERLRATTSPKIRTR